MKFGSELQIVFKGLRFLSCFLTPRYFLLNSQEDFLKSKFFAFKKYRMRVITPKGFEKQKTNAILLIHGMSAKGIDDSRILNLATSLAKTGYQVFLPELEEVKKLLIQKETIDHIYDLLVSLIECKEKYGWRNLGFFSISFTGGMGLISLVKLEAEDLKSILVVGPYGNFKTTLPYVLEHYDKDSYGSLVFLYNFIHKIMEKSEALEKLFYESALDNGLYRKGKDQVAHKLRHNMDASELELFDKFCSDHKFRHQLGEEISAQLNSFMEELSPINYIDKIKAPITIIHGKNDFVISESESIELAKRLKAKGQNHLLEITGLLSHGDAVPFHRQVPNIYGFARAFGYFFKNLEV
jgi:esterase/lipase